MLQKKRSLVPSVVGGALLYTLLSIGASKIGTVSKPEQKSFSQVQRETCSSPVDVYRVTVKKGDYLLKYVPRELAALEFRVGDVKVQSGKVRVNYESAGEGLVSAIETFMRLNGLENLPLQLPPRNVSGFYGLADAINGIAFIPGKTLLIPYFKQYVDSKGGKKEGRKPKGDWIRTLNVETWRPREIVRKIDSLQLGGGRVEIAGLGYL